MSFAIMSTSMLLGSTVYTDLFHNVFHTFEIKFVVNLSNYLSLLAFSNWNLITCNTKTIKVTHIQINGIIVSIKE